MKSIRTVLIMLIVMPCVFGGSAQELLGDWVNTDAQGIPKIAITKDKGIYKIRAWGRCTPEPCDWGETTLTILGDSVNAQNLDRAIAQWDAGFADKLMLIKFEGKASDYFTKEINGKKMEFRDSVPQIFVEVFTIFKDDSDRSNYRDISLLHKAHREEGKQD